MQVLTDAVASDIDSWAGSRPAITRDFQHDADGHSKFWLKGYELLGALPDKPKRSPEQLRAAEMILSFGRESREAFLGGHVQAVYAALTRGQTSFVRAEDLAYDAANLVPGLTPTRAQVGAQSEKPQRDKDGIEAVQGILLSRVLAHADCGAHLCHAMLLPSAKALALRDEFQAKGAIHLGLAQRRVVLGVEVAWIAHRDDGGLAVARH